MKHLNTDPHFLEAIEKYGLSTEAGAEKRINKVFGATLDQRPLTFIINMGGRYMPVAVFNNYNSFHFAAAAHAGIYCTN